MAKRLNDTRALTEQPSRYGEDHTVSTRKIDNGYLVRESSCDPRTGEYRSSEQFYKEPPRIIPARVARGQNPDQGSGLADTMKYLADGE